ncbi:MAG: hypothetical protein H6936_14640 [Burkholderiales bacterium]|nr:hypothetical protein [Burkholderiales bacterium]
MKARFGIEILSGKAQIVFEQVTVTIGVNRRLTFSSNRYNGNYLNPS